MTLVPLLVLFVGIVVFEEHPVGWLQDHWAELPRIFAAGLILAVYYGLVGLAVSSLTGRRAFAIGGYLLLLVAPTVLCGLLCEAIGPNSDDADWTCSASSRCCRSTSPRSLCPDADVPNSTGAWASVPARGGRRGRRLTLLRRYRKGSEA